jgi:hypothetical protein
MRPALTLTLAAVATLFALQAQAAEQTRSVAPFTVVSNSGPANLAIEVGKAQSVTVSGSDEYLQDLHTEVVDGELRISIPNGSHIDDRHWGNMKITITVPQLAAFNMSGAGNTTITHMSGDKLAVHFAGAGNLRADGSVKRLTMNIGGVGSIDTRELHAEDAEVNVGGVGSVKVFASDRLDASLGGVGSLTYYGDPKTVNTHGGGLGNISKAK